MSLTFQGIVEYFLKWVGYDDSHNCWIPEFDVSLDLIQEFEQRQRKETKNESEEEVEDHENTSRQVYKRRKHMNDLWTRYQSKTLQIVS
jgi:hypothetical protein